MLLPIVALALFFQAAEKPALKGLDPVELTNGRETLGIPEFTAKYLRYTYVFSSQENLDKFQKDKLAYSIQNGGACGSMGPLSGKGDPDRFTVYKNKIYIFASDGCRNGFLREPSIYSAKLPDFKSNPVAKKVEAIKLWESAKKAHGITPSKRMTVQWWQDTTYIQDGEEKIWRSASHLNNIDSFYTHSYTVGTDGYKTGIYGNESFDSDSNGTFSLHPDERRALRAKFMRHPYAILTLPAEAILEGEESNPSTHKTFDKFSVSVKGIHFQVLLDPETHRILTVAYTDYAMGRPLYMMRHYSQYKEFYGVQLPTAWKTATYNDGEDPVYSDDYVVNYQCKPLEVKAAAWIPSKFDPTKLDIDP